MNKLVPLATAAALLGLVGPASARPAVTGDGVDMTLDRTTLYAGETLRATVSADLDCRWVLTWNGERRTHAGRSFTTSYVAPDVTRRTVVPLRATCFYDTAADRKAAAAARAQVAPDGGASQTIVVTVPPSRRSGAGVTVLPPTGTVSPPGSGVGGDGLLPDTGGPAFWALLAGLVAALVGSVVVRRNRRRPSAG